MKYALQRINTCLLRLLCPLTSDTQRLSASCRVEPDSWAHDTQPTYALLLSPNGRAKKKGQVEPQPMTCVGLNVRMHLASWDFAATMRVEILYGLVGLRSRSWLNWYHIHAVQAYAWWQGAFRIQLFSKKILFILFFIYTILFFTELIWWTIFFQVTERTLIPTVFEKYDKKR